EEGYLHNEVKPEGVKTFTYIIPKKNSFVFYLKHIMFLASFTRKNKIDIVYSHIQVANFISCIAQYFSPSRFILTRHHTDCAFLDYNFNERTMDRIINTLGKEFIASSKKVYDQMVNVEHVKKSKVQTIFLAYDFNQIPKPENEAVNALKEKYKTKLLIVQASRLIPEKRNFESITVIKRLIDNKFDIKLLVLGEGTEKPRIENYIKDNHLENHIFMVGYRRDMVNYIAVADLLIHISVSEASNSTVKEAAILDKPVIICRDVGDFDDYINDGNGIMLSKENTEKELYDVLEKIYLKEKDVKALGINLHKSVLNQFSIDNIISQYDQFHTK
ncbi:MAG TPA: glycosyltransferase, partial [Bacteroidia bacterium]|nr:glycosyltransferase [Bacteroidia bacterium]